MTTRLSSDPQPGLPQQISMSRTGGWLRVSRRHGVDPHHVLGTIPVRTLSVFDGPAELLGGELSEGQRL
jgi:hypothetical protein